MIKRKTSNVSKSDHDKMNSTQNESFYSSKSKKSNYFEMIYAYTEKDKTVEKLNLEEFNSISFCLPVPNIVVDFIKYCTGFELYPKKARVMITPNFEHMDVEINMFKKQLGSKNFNTLLEGFLRLCANPDAIIDSHWYITHESMKKNFGKIFGEYNEYFCNIFYYYLSKGYENSKVPLASFVKSMHVFLGEEKIPIMSKVFSFYDINHDGKITFLDLVHAQTFVPCDSQLGEEISQIVETYLNEVVLSRRRRLIFEITKSNFDMFLKTSCVVSELLSKLFRVPYKSWPEIENKSIFSRRKLMSSEEYHAKMKFYFKMYTDLYDDKSCEVIGEEYERVNKFMAERK